MTLSDLRAQKQSLNDLRAQKQGLNDLRAQKQGLSDLRAQNQGLSHLRAQNQGLNDLRAQSQGLSDLQVQNQGHQTEDRRGQRKRLTIFFERTTKGPTSVTPTLERFQSRAAAGESFERRRGAHQRAFPST